MFKNKDGNNLGNLKIKFYRNMFIPHICKTLLLNMEAERIL